MPSDAAIEAFEVPVNSGRRLQRQGLFPNFRLHRVRRIASVESALMIVGHRFERTVTVSRFGQTSGVQQQEILGAKNLPLDYVDKFVEVQGFICGVGPSVPISLRHFSYP
jgi:hypothetical protein